MRAYYGRTFPTRFPGHATFRHHCDRIVTWKYPTKPKNWYPASRDHAWGRELCKWAIRGQRG